MPLRGRHRRYRPNRVSQASLTVTAGGAGLALPLIGLSSAHAAGQPVWEKVASCESSGDWNINTGNGFYGGLQFAASTWKSFGGSAYAPRADLATKNQQIAIAEKVLRSQGPGAWPVCSIRAGLTREAATASHTVRIPAPKAKPAAPRHTEQLVADTLRTEHAGHAGHSGKAAADPQHTGKASATPHRAKETAKTPKQGHEQYTVAAGDTLSGIAADEHIHGGWPKLYADNRAVVGGNPDLILPGQHLSLTAPATKPKAAPKTTPKATPKPAAKPAGGTRTLERQTKPAVAPKHGGYTLPVEHAPIGTRYDAQGGSWASGYHTGVDFLVSTGTSVHSVAAGKIVTAGWGGSYGYQVVIEHADGHYSQYGHLSQISVKVGQRVNEGQRIGRSGATGNATGPHLHFEMRTGPVYGDDIDPLRYLRAHGVSV
ncbi:transglycosylase family protein [Streptomyces sp. NBC_01190]|uniref:transglycosylase family protein n=1 Tax=Streptomyces sp. NBC_01190 TaxID=2903767 RepID=UPI003870CD27|nr:transglycosylase family protein [Streptomyces sp. NBC_01190]